jgi:hypothetical protein
MAKLTAGNIIPKAEMLKSHRMMLALATHNIMNCGLPFGDEFQTKVMIEDTFCQAVRLIQDGEDILNVLLDTPISETIRNQMRNPRSSRHHIALSTAITYTIYYACIISGTGEQVAQCMTLIDRQQKRFEQKDPDAIKDLRDFKRCINACENDDMALILNLGLVSGVATLKFDHEFNLTWDFEIYDEASKCYIIYLDKDQVDMDGFFDHVDNDLEYDLWEISDERRELLKPSVIVGNLLTTATLDKDEDVSLLENTLIQRLAEYLLHKTDFEEKMAPYLKDGHLTTGNNILSDFYKSLAKGDRVIILGKVGNEDLDHYLEGRPDCPPDMFGQLGIDRDILEEVLTMHARKAFVPFGVTVN